MYRLAAGRSCESRITLRILDPTDHRAHQCDLLVQRRDTQLLCLVGHSVGTPQNGQAVTLIFFGYILRANELAGSCTRSCKNGTTARGA